WPRHPPRRLNLREVRWVASSSCGECPKIAHILGCPCGAPFLKPRIVNPRPIGEIIPPVIICPYDRRTKGWRIAEMGEISRAFGRRLRDLDVLIVDDNANMRLLL